jgi:hypothetical protein
MPSPPIIAESSFDLSAGQQVFALDARMRWAFFSFEDTPPSQSQSSAYFEAATGDISIYLAQADAAGVPWIHLRPYDQVARPIATGANCITVVPSNATGTLRILTASQPQGILNNVNDDVITNVASIAVVTLNSGTNFQITPYNAGPAIWRQSKLLLQADPANTSPVWLTRVGGIGFTPGSSSWPIQAGQVLELDVGPGVPLFVGVTVGPQKLYVMRLAN